MAVIDFLLQRSSYPAKALIEPAPSDAELAQIVAAGLAAPDHGGMKPWRILSIRGSARERLGEIFQQGARLREPEADEQSLQAHLEKPLRSPLILAVIARVRTDNPKVPPIEQVLSAGAAAQQMILAANALGYGAVWLTGPYAFDKHVHKAFNMRPEDELVGFLYLGTPSIAQPERQRPAVEQHLENWSG